MLYGTCELEGLQVNDTELKELSLAHKGALRLLLLGWSLEDVCKAFSITKPRMSAIKHSAVGEEYIKHLSTLTDQQFAQAAASSALPPKIKDVRARLEEEAPKNLDRLIQLREVADDNVSARVSMDMLDRAGYKAPDKVEMTAKVLSSEALVAALNFAKQRKKVS